MIVWGRCWYGQVGNVEGIRCGCGGEADVGMGLGNCLPVELLVYST